MHNIILVHILICFQGTQLMCQYYFMDISNLIDIILSYMRPRAQVSLPNSVIMYRRIAII